MSTRRAKPTPPIQLTIDARALQDERFRDRGIGQHINSLLAGRADSGGPFRLLALTDPALPPLRPPHAALFDATVQVTPPPAPLHALLSPSPMTHPPLPVARLLRSPAFCAAIVYDFIPLDHAHHYLADPAQALENASRLLWLRDHDRFYPISAATRSRLHDLFHLPAHQAVVTGVAVRDALLAPPGSTPMADAANPYLLVAAGDDWRKNVEAPIAAHARSAILDQANVRLVVAGGYPPERQHALRALHQSLGGRPALLEFLPLLSDKDLRRAYAAALATIAPSRAEGFSIPVIEASANACPVIASDIPPHRELLGDPQDHFPADDIPLLQLRMETYVLRPEARAEARQRQAGIAPHFSAQSVCARFWSDLGHSIRSHAEARSRTLAAAIARGAKPVIAFATPLPPDKSGVADYSAATLTELCKRAEVRVYTDTPAPHPPGAPDLSPGITIERLSPMAYLSGRHDAVVSVIGNSSFHLGIFNELLQWGGATIAHDARMLNFYYELLGERRTLETAGAELQRPVKPEELERWLEDTRRLPTLFLSEVARVSQPLFVHSPTTAALLERQGIRPVLLPFSPYRVLTDHELSPHARAAARQTLMIPGDELLIATFGNVMADRAIEDCLWAVETLRAWNIPARLACIGPIEPGVARDLHRLAAAIGMSSHLITTPQGVPEAVYRLWLQAADFGVQLRTHRLGSISGALLDCIAAALPTVANTDLAEAIDAPPWVHRIPNAISAVLIAEQLALMATQRLHIKRPLGPRKDMLEQRGFPAYCTKLMQSLGFDVRQ